MSTDPPASPSRIDQNRMDPYRIDIPQGDLDDLHDRLDRTRWPDELPGAGWDYGIPGDELRALAHHWRHTYDWRAAEAELNRWPQFTTTVDGAHIHFAHIRSPEPDATPLIMTHGWPGSIVEFTDVAARSPTPARTAATRPTPSTWCCRASPASDSRAPRGRRAGSTDGWPGRSRY